MRLMEAKAHLKLYTPLLQKAELLLLCCKGLLRKAAAEALGQAAGAARALRFRLADRRHCAVAAVPCRRRPAV